jgi:hypothetical protein
MLYRFASAESLGAWGARLVAAGTTRPLASLKLSGADDLMVQ